MLPAGEFSNLCVFELPRLPHLCHKVQEGVGWFKLVLKKNSWKSSLQLPHLGFAFHPGGIFLVICISGFDTCS